MPHKYKATPFGLYDIAYANKLECELIKLAKERQTIINEKLKENLNENLNKKSKVKELTKKDICLINKFTEEDINNIFKVQTKGSNVKKCNNNLKAAAAAAGGSI